MALREKAPLAANDCKHSTSRPSRTARVFPLSAFAFWILGGLIGIALCAAWVRSISISPQYGSFTWLDAPNQAFTAEARTTRKKWFWGGMREYFEVTIAKFDRVRQQYDPNYPWHYPPERTIILDRIEGLAFPFERGRKRAKSNGHRIPQR